MFCFAIQRALHIRIQYWIDVKGEKKNPFKGKRENKVLILCCIDSKTV